MDKRLKPEIPLKLLNSVRVRQHVIDLAHDCVGALQRGGVGQLNLQEGVTLVLFWDKTGRKASCPFPPAITEIPTSKKQCDYPPANEDMAPAHVASGHCSEPCD